MKHLSTISWIIVGGFIGWYIGTVLGDLYRDSLTRGPMPRDLQEIKLFPWLLCAVGAFLAGKLARL